MRQTRSERTATAGVLAAVLAAGLTVTALPGAARAADSASSAGSAGSADVTSAFTSTENPILADGSYYSADPAPVVVPAGAPGNGTGADQLYVYTGHDEAGVTQNDFIMNEWGAFVTSDVDAGEWTHHPSLMRPEQVFSWATPGRAYAGEVQQGVDGRYYWYVPVHEANSPAGDKFGIGVAVSNSPTGPWTDHAGGPIVSQRVPTSNNIHNIDPTVLVDGAGANRRVHMYWGSFGNLRRIELAQDMKTPVSPVRSVTGLPGFFEAPWLFERDGTYYLAYAGNNAGPDSPCTPAHYHACISYASAPSAEGPWTYRGRVLAPVSSTTSHPGIVELNGQWWIAYHTADAEGGNHFRRAAAIDRVEWDDTQNPPRMLPVTTTPVKERDRTPRANIAQEADVTVSNEPVPTQYWKKALNDEIVRPNPLPPDMWGTWDGNHAAQEWIQYTWDQPVRVSGSQIEFWNDRPPGSGVGVAPPRSWRIQYWRDGGWADVPAPSGYPTGTSGFQNTSFAPVTTTRLRAVFDASTNGSSYAAVAVEEWKVLSAQAETVTPPRLTVDVGQTEVSGDVSATYPGGHTLQVPGYWDDLAPEDVEEPGEVPVRGSVLGHTAGRISATVTVVDRDGQDDVAPLATPTASYTAGWNSVLALNDGRDPADPPQSEIWGTWSGNHPATQWVRYDWDRTFRLTAAEIKFWNDQPQGSGIGVARPDSWELQYWDESAGQWAPVPNPSGSGTSSSEFNRMTFDPVTTSRLRAIIHANGDGTQHSAVGATEWRVFAGDPDAERSSAAATAPR